MQTQTIPTQGNGSEGGGLRGFITDRHLADAEVEFPGIVGFYQECAVRPRTFLDLLRLFLAQS
jgi:hypothetical protein